MTTPEGEEIKAAPVSGKVATIEVGQSSKVITVALLATIVLLFISRLPERTELVSFFA